MVKSLLSKIKDIYVEDSEFTPDGATEPIKYKRLIIQVQLDGEPEQLQFVPSDSQGKAGYTLLRVADDVKSTVASTIK